jgi:hypothetical protein
MATSPDFYLRFGAVSFSLYSNPTSMSLQWGTNVKTFLYSNYPTVGSLKAAIKNLAGLDTTGNILYDGIPSTSIPSYSPVPLSPTVTILNIGFSILLFTVTDDGIYNHQYKIDDQGLEIDWDSSGKYYDYVTFPTMVSMKSAINGDVPGLDATGNSGFNSFGTGFQTVSLTSIPPDATVFPGLRECSVDYQTIDDMNLSLRRSFAGSRLSEVSDRLTFLNQRKTQVLNHIIDEQYLRSTDGKTGNIYDWANNRFNRSVGCEARLKQVEKLIEMNQSSLGVSSRFF